MQTAEKIVIADKLMKRSFGATFLERGCRYAVVEVLHPSCRVAFGDIKKNMHIRPSGFIIT